MVSSEYSRQSKESSRALGSAREGVRHWWSQRVSAIALAFLSVWFLLSFRAHPLYTLEDVYAWLAVAHRPVLMSLFLVTLFYHAYLGIQVVIEDYVHGRILRISLLLAAKFLCFIMAFTGLFSVLKLALYPRILP